MNELRAAETVRVPANRTVTKHLGHWTTARRFEVRNHRGLAVLDLRSPRIADGDIEVAVDIDHGVVKLLLPDDAVIDDWNLRRTGRGKVKDGTGPTSGGGGRRVVITGSVRDGQIRVQRGGVAIVSAMFSKAYLADLRRVRREGGYPTVDDPTRAA
jgi:hypothetical protein